MRISASRTALAALVAGLAIAAPASAAIDRTVTVSPGETTGTATWTGATGSGLNTSYLLDGIGPFTGTCGSLDDPQTACETTLVHVTGDPVGSGTVTFRIDGFLPVSDFDLHVFASNAAGDAEGDAPTPTGDSQSSPLGDDDPRATSAGDYETVTMPISGEGEPLDSYFLVQVPYFAVANDAYTGHVKVEATPYVAPEPEDEE